MERLSGLDAGFLYMETPTLHMHTLKIAIVDPSTAESGYSFETFRSALAERLHLLPPFRRRLVEVPGRIHHPVWIEDPAFDLGMHIRRVGCPAPGGEAEFCELVSDIASRQLARDRALWEIWVIEGLAGGLVGFVAKIHHALADGMAAAALLANIADALGSSAAETSAEAWKPEEVPGKRQLFLDAGKDLARELRYLPRLLKTTFKNITGLRKQRKSADLVPPLPFAGPKTSFNRALQVQRTFTTASLSLTEAKKLKDRYGATLNDVVLCVVAGALRRYLAERKELPEAPLIAGVPVSTIVDPKRLSGNKVSNMFTSLRTDIEDPVERLRSIHEVTKVAKQFHELLGSEMLRDWSEVTPPRPFAWFMRTYSRRAWASRHRPPINLVVSNVPGPREELKIAGAKITGLYSMGPILEGIGLNVTVWSYVDTLNFGLVTCPAFIDDLWELTTNLRRELEALTERAESDTRERRDESAGHARQDVGGG